MNAIQILEENLLKIDERIKTIDLQLKEIYKSLPINQTHYYRDLLNPVHHNLWEINKYLNRIEREKENIRYLPPSLSLEDINKLQRYSITYDAWYDWYLLEKEDDWKYVRYNDLIDLLK